MRRAAAIAVALLGVIAACSDGSSSSTTAAPPTSVSAGASSLPSATAADPTPASALPAITSASTTGASTPATGWEKVTAPSQCMCADGSAYTYWIHRGASDKVVFFLEGGGACVDASTCAFNSRTYRSKIGAEDDPNGMSSGIFDFSNARNPLADYSFVFAPYCTGDVHLGNATHVYGPQLTVQHKGSVNATTALTALAKQFPNTTQLVVAGESAGSVPTPMYAGIAHDLLPKAAITVLADGSGAYPDDPTVNTRVGEVWGTANAIPPWPENAGLTSANWGAPDLFVQAFKHDPQIVFGRHDYAYDFVQTIFTALLGFPSKDLLATIDANGAQIKKSGVDLRSFIAPGLSHTVLSSRGFYTETVGGVLLVDWVTGLIRRQPDPDVHCTVCK
jgi:hypothetical protein